MKVTRPVLILFPVLLFFHCAKAQQSSLRLSAEVPVQFGLGYEGKISKRFSVAVSAGLLTQPNSTIIVNVLNELGTDEEITLMIEDAFKFGVVGELDINYNFNRNYVGCFVQVIGLHAGETPTSLIEDYFGTSVNSYPVKRGKTQSVEKYLKLNSTLYQAGILYGRRFPLKNKRFEIDAEFGFSANVGSNSTLSSDVRNLSTLSTAVDAELSGYYASYAFVPSLSVALVYKLRTR